MGGVSPFEILRCQMNLIESLELWGEEVQGGVAVRSGGERLEQVKVADLMASPCIAPAIDFSLLKEEHGDPNYF